MEKITRRIYREEYRGVLVTSMIRALKSREINPHLNIEEKNKLSIIHNQYKQEGSINGTQMNLVYLYYYNFVMHGYRHKIK